MNKLITFSLLSCLILSCTDEELIIDANQYLIY